MRAVNLIPSDIRPGAGGAAGRSGGAAYAVLGGLALAVAMFGAYTKTNASLHDKEAKVASLEQQATSAEAHASSLVAYTTFADLRTKRVATVKQLAAGRFDWAHALHEVARVLPANAWLTQLTGTTSPSVNIPGGGAGGTSTLRGTLPVPAIEMTGCTTSQASVAKMMARMRLIDGVQRVSLSDAQKSDTASSGGSGGAGCDVSTHFPTFNIVVFFAPQSDGPADAAAAATATAAAATAPAAATPSATTTPSTTTTPAGSTPTSTTPATTGETK